MSMKRKQLWALNRREWLFVFVQLLIFWPLQFFAGVALIIPGLFLVPLVIYFAKVDPIAPAVNWTYKNKTGLTYHGLWQLLTVPKSNPLWIFSNDRDGLLGDKRGWYASEIAHGDPWKFWPKYNWAALRNSVGNLRYASWYTCNILVCDFETYGTNPEAGNHKGGAGWQLTIAKRDGGLRCYFGFSAWIPYSFWPGRGCLIKAGNKIHGASEEDARIARIAYKGRKMSRWEALEFYKGAAFYVNPFQSE